MMNPPNVRGFRPFGVSETTDTPVKMLFEEYEALKLADYEKMSQEKAAESMDVSRPTFTRIYDRALKKVATALIETKSIIIEGGNVHFDDNWYRCKNCHSVFKTNRPNLSNCAVCDSENIEHINAGFDDKQPDADEYCVCIKCGNKEKHEKGMPCRDVACPNCGAKMKKG